MQSDSPIESVRVSSSPVKTAANNALEHNADIAKGQEVARAREYFDDQALRCAFE